MLFRRLLLLLMAVGLAAGSLALTRRPAPAPVVELALEYTSARRFAARQGYDLDRLLEQFRAAGITTLLVGETSLYDMTHQGQMGYPLDYPVQVSVQTAAEVLARAAAEGTPPPPVDPEWGYVFIRRNPDLAGWLEQMLTARLGPDRVRRWDAAAAPPGADVIALRAGVQGDFLLMPLGILPADVALARRYGLRVAAALTQRPLPLNPQDETQLMRTADPAAVAATLPPGADLVYIRGREVPGYPDRVDRLAAALRQRGMVLAIHRAAGGAGPAFPAGLPALAEELGLRALKAYPVSYRDRVSDWVTAVKDRDIRFLVFEAFLLSAGGAEDVARQVEWLHELTARLAAAGFTTGAATAPEGSAPAGSAPAGGPASAPGGGPGTGPGGAPGSGPVPAPGWAIALVALGTAAAVLELAFRFWAPAPASPPAAVAAAAVLALAALAAAPTLALRAPVAGGQLLALAAAVAYPSIGVLAAASRGLDVQLRSAAAAFRGGGAAPNWRWRADLAAGLRLALPVVLWSLAGGVAVHALLLDRHFWLELALFRGVKLTLVAPTLVMLAYWAWQRRERFLAGAVRLGDAQVRLGPLLAGGAALAAVGLLLIRSAYAGVEVSGATLAPVSQAELLLRSRLEEWLYVRPRTKEIFFGYPAVLLAAWLLRRGRRGAGLAALAAGAVAGASVVNSFSHAHVPAALSLLRSFHGLWLGLVAGGALLAVLGMWQRLQMRRSADG